LRNRRAERQTDAGEQHHHQGSGRKANSREIAGSARLFRKGQEADRHRLAVNQRRGDQGLSDLVGAYVEGGPAAGAAWRPGLDAAQAIDHLTDR
jgi:hypothetical protein